jgi:uncharacterized membrane-anchored protein YitT (DUF2179 family)
MKKRLTKYPVLDYIVITIGAAIMAIGIGVFLIDAKVVPGGVTGISMALHYLTNEKLPVGFTIWILNIPIYLWGLKELGKRFGVRTFYAFTLNSFFIDFFRGDIPGLRIMHLQDSAAVHELLKHDFFFLIFVAAALLGGGLGLIFKFKGTTGGTDVIAAILNKKFGIKTGNAMLMTDLVIVSFAGLVLQFKHVAQDKPTLVLVFYAIFLIYISARIVDLIIDGFDYARSAFIISDKNDEIAKAIITNLSRGATAIRTRGLYKNVERDVIYTVVTLKELARLTDMIQEIDPDAFVTINNVHEVLGSGFRRRL